MRRMFVLNLKTLVNRKSVPMPEVVRIVNVCR